MFGPLYNLHKNPLIRRLVLPALKRFNPGDIHIRHHHTGDPVLLHSFRHKGYWFHGRRREQDTMQFFRQALQPGDCVIEIGGHIGYISMYFADLVGSTGQVVVFEPGSNNLPYIRVNVAKLPQVCLIEKAVSDQDGEANFFEEPLTGQNNSLSADYSVFAENCQRAFTTAEYSSRAVRTVRLDSFLEQSGYSPQLLKIDIEGSEFRALTGARQTLAKHRPMVMVEVTEHKQEVFELFREFGYSLYLDTGLPLTSADSLDFNACALHPERHAAVLARLGWQRARAA